MESSQPIGLLYIDWLVVAFSLMNNKRFPKDFI